MATVRDRIKRAMRLIGAVATGEVPSADELADGLTSLNGMMSSWSLEGLMVPSIVREEFTLVASQQRYSIGTSGDFNTSRPVKIDRATLEVQGADPYELLVEILNLDEWVNIRSRALTSELPTCLYAEGTFPLDYLNLWPVPTTAHKLVLYSEKVITTFTTVSDSVSLPPGYEDAIDFNLAIRLAPEYGKAVSPEVIKIAQDSVANIMIQNSKPQYLECDAALLNGSSGFDIRAME